MDKTPQKQRSSNGLQLMAGSVAILLTVASVIGGIAWIKSGQIIAASSAPPPPEMPVAVKLFDAQPFQFRQKTVVVGSVLAHQSIELRNELTGVVTDVDMIPGGIVKAGDRLVQLDDRTQKAELKAAQATSKLALTSLERARKLMRANANSDQELDVAFAEATRSQAEVDRLITVIDRMKMVAPFDARVGLFELHAGQYLNEGTRITTLEGIADYLNVDFTVPAQVADSIVIGDAVSMQADESGPSWDAEIVAMDSRADPVSRSLKVRAKLNDPPKTLLPGDSVRVAIPFGPTLEAVTVPATAIRRGPTGTMVYLAVEASPSSQLRAKSQVVQTAGGGGTMTPITSGVQPGERVVTDGSFKVMEGSLLAPTE